MSQPMRKLVEPAQPMPEYVAWTTSDAVLDGSVDGLESPARQLHQLLVDSFSPVVREPEHRLPVRTRFAILVGSIALLWGMIGAAAFALA